MTRKKTAPGKKAAARKKTSGKPAKRTVKQAAANVQSGAERARELGAAIVRAGELIEQAAAMMDSMATRAKTSRKKR